MEIDSIISETTGIELSEAHGNKDISNDHDENVNIPRKKVTQHFSDCETAEENIVKVQSPRHNFESASSDEETISKRQNRMEISDTGNELLSCVHSNEDISDDNDENLISRRKTLTQFFSDCETDDENIDKVQTDIVDKDINPRHNSQSTSSDEERPSKAKQRSRIRKMSSSDNNSDSSSNNVEVNVRQGNRIKQKKNNMRKKFDSLLSTRNKSIEDTDSKKCMENDAHSDSNLSSTDESNTFREENNQRHIIDQSIYDKDSSDDEINDISEIKKKSKYKSTKMISPQPLKNVRMSAKQAMENMHKIKSESNRMLREKEVSLPYHRPKAFTLKDVKNWKKPSVTKDGKALPVKMNEEQLKQYALLLEQRQKEIVELCKSDSEDDENKEEMKSTLTDNLSPRDEQECSNNLQGDENNIQGSSIINHNEVDKIDENQSNNEQQCSSNVQNDEDVINLSVLNDKIFDDLQGDENNVICPSIINHDIEFDENQTKNSSRETCLDIPDDDRQINTLMETDVSHETKNNLVNQENYIDHNDEECQSNRRTESDSMNTEDITLQLSPETNAYK